ncbi:MAG TPA: CerR family C-terminal domain-containing protein [Gammaproteobacteria bacterium]
MAAFSRTPVRREGTRAALIDAATRVFGRDGFHAATTKVIAREAGANPALISYHFGGKEGLYVAVVEHIIETMAARIGPIAVEVEAERRALEGAARGSGLAAPAAYFELLLRIVDRFVDVLTAEESAPWAKIIVREQQEPSPAFDLFYDGLHGRVLALVASLVARIGGRQSPTTADRLTTLAIVGDVLVFRVARATATRFLGWDTLGPKEIARIKKAVRRNVGAMLGVATE